MPISSRQGGSTVGDVWVGSITLGSGVVCHVLVRYDDNTTVEADVRSRKANPSLLRCASATVHARWIGQDRQDLTGSEPASARTACRTRESALSGLSPAVSGQVDPGRDVGRICAGSSA